MITRKKIEKLLNCPKFGSLDLESIVTFVILKLQLYLKLRLQLFFRWHMHQIFLQLTELNSRLQTAANKSLWFITSFLLHLRHKKPHTVFCCYLIWKIYYYFLPSFSCYICVCVCSFQVIIFNRTFKADKERVSIKSVRTRFNILNESFAKDNNT